jgi:predicted ATP-binding protein involved in virulence
VIVGENNAGKSNVIDALRTVLEPEVGPRARYWLREEDFAHDGHGTRIADELELEVQLSDKRFSYRTPPRRSAPGALGTDEAAQCSETRRRVARPVKASAGLLSQ